MMEVKFMGTAAEVKAEISDFMNLISTKKEDIEVKAEEKPRAEENTTAMVAQVEEKLEEPTVLPTLPTVSTEYTVEDLQRIGATLLRKDTANLVLLSNTLKNYGVNAVKELPKEHYGAFVQDLKKLGADV